MKRHLAFLVSFLCSGALLAQIPSGYYASAQGLTGQPLRQALHNIIDGHSQQSYTSLWTHFQQTDKKDNGKVWDMYSDVPGGTPPYQYTFSSDQCGNYTGEGDCYNREHSWPKSWFNDQYPAYSDLFHLYPTDGYVNSKRSNYPFGEVSNPSWTSQNGSKLGQNTHPGFTGTVFEPIDAYKGDFARTYFYMSTRYYTEDSGWGSNEMVDRSTLREGAASMLMEWHLADPVSEKELERNDAVHDIQGNRNPFIDHPEYAQQIWGAPNQQPYFVSEPVTQAEQGQPYTYQVQAQDPESDPLDFIFPFGTALPTWLQLEGYGSGQARLFGTPPATVSGPVSLTLTVTDGISGNVSQPFTLEVDVATGVSSPAQASLRFDALPADERLGCHLWLDRGSEVGLALFDATGQMVWASHLGGRPAGELSWEVPTAGLAEGLYFLRVEANALVASHKVMVKH